MSFQPSSSYSLAGISEPLKQGLPVVPDVTWREDLPGWESPGAWPTHSSQAENRNCSLLHHLSLFSVSHQLQTVGIICITMDVCAGPHCHLASPLELKLKPSGKAP